MTFAEYLTNLLYEKRVNANQLAKKTGISHAEISRMKKGKEPTAKSIVKISEALKVSEIDLFKAAGLVKSCGIKPKELEKYLADLNKEEFENTVPRLLEKYMQRAIDEKVFGTHVKQEANEILSALMCPDAYSALMKIYNAEKKTDVSTKLISVSKKYNLSLEKIAAQSRFTIAEVKAVYKRKHKLTKEEENELSKAIDAAKKLNG